ncbi:MAG: hypothetical protein K0S34_1847 [Bacillales bacterium]|jgi:hypothetical protein|nr:hypothetical protein [Bacillales bacterium]
MLRSLTFIAGLVFASIGGISLVIYLNLLPMGNSFISYLKFISTRVECYSLLVGMFLIYFSIMKN